MSPIRATGAAVVLAVAAATGVPAQGALPRSAYERAEALDRPSANRLVKNILVVPHWIGASDDLWYRRETQAGATFVVVDAATGKGRPAFDHAAVAAAIGKAAGNSANPEQLPFVSLRFDEDRAAIAVTVGSRDYRCRLQPVDCEPATAPPTLEGGAASPDGRSAVFGRNGNLWIHDFASGADRALTDDGEAGLRLRDLSRTAGRPRSFPRERATDAGHPLPPFETSWSPDSRIVIVAAGRSASRRCPIRSSRRFRRDGELPAQGPPGQGAPGGRARRRPSNGSRSTWPGPDHPHRLPVRQLLVTRSRIMLAIRQDLVEPRQPPPVRRRVRRQHGIRVPVRRRRRRPAPVRTVSRSAAALESTSTPPPTIRLTCTSPRTAGSDLVVAARRLGAPLPVRRRDRPAPEPNHRRHLVGS